MLNRSLLRKLPYGADVIEALDAHIKQIASHYIEELRRDADNEANPIRDIVVRCVDQLCRRTDAQSQPNNRALSLNVRENRHALWNTKVLGSELARLLYETKVAGPSAPIPPAPVRVDLSSKICTQEDIEQDWLRYWCGQLRIAPLYHRKIWEDCFALQALWEHDMLRPERSGLGFAVGVEPLPAYLASTGVSVLATDLRPDDPRAEGWRATNQHAEGLNGLFRGDLLLRERFDELCQFQSVDMNEIPADLHGRFDFCWSICSFEHLGSIERGLAFVAESMRCLKAGGIAVHTTEFNLDGTGETIDNWATVLFQRRHIEDLVNRLAAEGHRLYKVDYHTGQGVLDQFIDVPPFSHQDRVRLQYPDPPHLRISVDGFPATSIGLIAQARA
jgi:SAM-dependent methyltransferase